MYNNIDDLPKIAELKKQLYIQISKKMDEISSATEKEREHNLKIINAATEELHELIFNNPEVQEPVIQLGRSRSSRNLDQRDEDFLMKEIMHWIFQDKPCKKDIKLILKASLLIIYECGDKDIFRDFCKQIEEILIYLGKLEEYLSAQIKDKQHKYNYASQFKSSRSNYYSRIFIELNELKEALKSVKSDQSMMKLQMKIFNLL